jgi:predicted nucleotidyltransferase
MKNSRSGARVREREREKEREREREIERKRERERETETLFGHFRIFFPSEFFFLFRARKKAEIIFCLSQTF